MFILEKVCQVSSNLLQTTYNFRFEEDNMHLATDYFFTPEPFMALLALLLTTAIRLVAPTLTMPDLFNHRVEEAQTQHRCFTVQFCKLMVRHMSDVCILPSHFEVKSLVKIDLVCCPVQISVFFTRHNLCYSFGSYVVPDVTFGMDPVALNVKIDIVFSQLSCLDLLIALFLIFTVTFLLYKDRAPCNCLPMWYFRSLTSSEVGGCEAHSMSMSSQIIKLLVLLGTRFCLPLSMY